MSQGFGRCVFIHKAIIIIIMIYDYYYLLRTRQQIGKIKAVKN